MVWGKALGHSDLDKLKNQQKACDLSFYFPNEVLKVSVILMETQDPAVAWILGMYLQHLRETVMG